MALPDAVRRSRHRRRIKRIRQRAGPPPDPTFWWGPAFQQRQGDDLRKPYAAHPWLFRAVTVLVDNLLSVPLRVYTGDRNDPTEQESGPEYDLLQSPHPEIASGLWWSLVWQYQLLSGGECFLVKRMRDGKPVPTAQTLPEILEPYPGTEFKEKMQGDVFVGWERIVGAAPETFAPFEVVQLRLPNPYDARRGLSPLDAAMRSVRTDHKAQIFNEASLDHDAEPGGILQAPENKNLTPEQANSIRMQWEDRHGGYGKARRPAVLHGGLTWQQTGVNPKDMEFSEQRKTARKEIASAYGVPEMLIGEVDTIHSKESARVLLMLFWENTCLPHATRVQQALTQDLFKEPTQGNIWTRFDFSDVKALQREESEKMDVAAKQRELGWSPREVNDSLQLNLPDFEGDDIRLVPGSLQPLLLTDTPAETDGALAGLEGTAGTQDVEVLEDLVLNGAQISAALEIVLNVANGDLPRDSGLGMLITLFNLTPDQASAIMGSAGTQTPTTPNPKPGDTGDTPPPPPPPVPPPTNEDEGAPPELEDEEEEERGAAVRAADERAARWRAYVNDVQGPAERKFKKQVQTWLRVVRKETLKFVAGGRAVRDLAAGEVDAWLIEQQDRWDEKLADLTQPINESLVGTVLDKSNVPTIDMNHPRILELLDTMVERIKIPSHTVQKHIRLQLLEGLGKGESMTGLQDRVRLVANVANNRALTIARTETGTAAQSANYEALKEGGATKTEWLSSRDSAVRDSHAAMDGERVPVGSAFSNGLMHPLDPSGHPSEVINCRCDMVEVFDDE